ncbi:MAG: hypothetical protein GX122_02695 [Candidatus Cloacimonetes bacterium]|nr:hypothetical protein [Candidatus Cloacimonadota bacterium]NLK50075.1 hypothetical protein [Candidatus Cloacimonadota bacterium]NLO11311.1 hypothetical protein [Candidatus Cloacimonadota bacterium]
MKRNIPLILAFVSGLIVIFSEFIPHRPFSSIVDSLQEWFMIISGFAMLLGVMSLLRMNAAKVSTRSPDWQYHLIGIISFGLMVLMGALWGMEEQAGILGQGASISAWLGKKPFDYTYTHVFVPLSATLFSLLAFFIASAAYRAFIIRTLESNLLMIAAVIVILGRTGFGTMLTGWLPESYRFWHLPNLADYIMQYPNTAAQRAIMISAALGVIGSGLRIILGIERSYLGGDK